MIRKPGAHSECFAGAAITTEQAEFGRAMEAWQRRNHRWPDFRDVLRVALSLGYRKPETNDAA